MMNCKEFERKRSFANFKILSGICLKGLRKTIKNAVRIAGLQAEI
jgi:hypothetical protein